MNLKNGQSALIYSSDTGEQLKIIKENGVYTFQLGEVEIHVTGEVEVEVENGELIVDDDDNN